MRPLTEILGMVTSLAAGNNTEELLPSVLSFIKYYYQEFQYDYVPCKNILNGRFKKGKLEEVLIYLFAELCNWSNTDENLRSVHSIMIGLGYYSYEAAAKRYRQMVENAKKDVKKNNRIRNRIRGIHAKVVSHKPVVCKEYRRRTEATEPLVVDVPVLPIERTVSSSLPMPLGSSQFLSESSCKRMRSVGVKSRVSSESINSMKPVNVTNSVKPMKPVKPMMSVISPLSISTMSTRPAVSSVPSVPNVPDMSTDISLPNESSEDSVSFPFLSFPDGTECGSAQPSSPMFSLDSDNMWNVNVPDINEDASIFGFLGDERIEDGYPLDFICACSSDIMYNY